jgi:hypothetical protein
VKATRPLVAASAAVLIALTAATRAPGPPLPHALLGCGPETVVATYGVPTESSSFAAGFAFRYRDKAGDLATFLFCGDAAVQVPGDGFAAAAIVAPKPGEAYSGQRAAEAAVCLGNPTGSSFSTTSLELSYAGGRKVTLQHGRVFF